jgi:hypothetical protein
MELPTHEQIPLIFIFDPLTEKEPPKTASPDELNVPSISNLDLALIPSPTRTLAVTQRELPRDNLS